ncbi:MAG: hypothetical protein M1835_005550 [Candelina submexicana]|nr:MAG: hypothetical protein M1835_005550 [Candelina submexicana]
MDDLDSPWANEKPVDPPQLSEATEPRDIELQAADSSLPSKGTTLGASQGNQTQLWAEGNKSISLDNLSIVPSSLEAALNDESRPWDSKSSHGTVRRTDSNSTDPDLKVSAPPEARSDNKWDGTTSSRTESWSLPSTLHSDARWSTSPKLQFATVPEPDVLESLTYLNSSTSIPTPTSARAKELIEFFEAKSGTTRPGSANDDRAPQLEDGDDLRSSSTQRLNAVGKTEFSPFSRRDESVSWPASSTCEWSSHGGEQSPRSPSTIVGGGTQRCGLEGGDFDQKDQRSKAQSQDTTSPNLDDGDQGGSIRDFGHSIPAFDDQGQRTAIVELDTPPSIIDVAAGAQKVSSFTANADLVGQLFPPNPVTDRPSSICKDILSSTSARKAWYRISRQGTMRKHDSGIEDYVRVSWVGSAVQASVNKVVGNWITEDQSGHSLGGEGNGLSSLFGWGEPPKPSRPKVESTFERTRFGSMVQRSKQSSTVKDGSVIPLKSSPSLIMEETMLPPHSPVVRPGWIHTPELSPALSEAPPLSISSSTLSVSDTDGFSRHPAELEEVEVHGKALEAKQQGPSTDAAVADEWGLLVNPTIAMFSDQPQVLPMQDMPVEHTVALMNLPQKVSSLPANASPTAPSHEQTAATHATRENPYTPGPSSSPASIPTSPARYPPSPIIPKRGSSRKHSILPSADISPVGTPSRSSKLAVSPITASQLPTLVMARKLPKTAEEAAEEAEILGKIARGLPDLSYMLKQ